MQLGARHRLGFGYRVDMLIRVLDSPSLVTALAAACSPGGRLLVHHFATWCEPCEEELPVLGKLLERARSESVRTIAVTWDRFLVNVKPEEIGRINESFLARLGCRFDELVVYVGTPDELFASQRIASSTVPYTEVRDDSGTRLEEFPSPILDEPDSARLLRVLTGAEVRR